MPSARCGRCSSGTRAHRPGTVQDLYPITVYCGRTPVIEAPSLRAGWMPKLQRYDATRYELAKTRV